MTSMPSARTATSSKSEQREREGKVEEGVVRLARWADLNGGHDDHDDNLVADQNGSKNIMINALVLTTENTNK